MDHVSLTCVRAEFSWKEGEEEEETKVTPGWVRVETFPKMPKVGFPSMCSQWDQSLWMCPLGFLVLWLPLGSPNTDEREGAGDGDALPSLQADWLWALSCPLFRCPD